MEIQEAKEEKMTEAVAAIGLAIQLFTTSDTVLLARAIGWEAPTWATQDRRSVASVIRYRMIDRQQTLREVLFDPGQFCVVPLLLEDPPEMGELFILAEEALAWDLEDLPVAASHFWSPVFATGPPYWADEAHRVEIPGTIHQFYSLD